MNPFKFCSIIDDNVKKHTNINGAKRKNKYINVIIFNSIIVSIYVYDIMIFDFVIFDYDF